MGAEDFASYGVPVFYMNEPVAEPAGGGNVRVWNCVRKCGMLIPVCEVIIPATELLIASRIITAAAVETYKRERQLLLAH